MKINKKKLLTWSLSTLFIGLFVWYFLANLNDFKILLTINLWYLIPLFFIVLLLIVSNGIFMKVSTGLFYKKLSLSESVRVSLISTAGNFFAPAGSGLGFRAVYLKKKHQLNYSHYISIVICNYILVFLISSVIGLVSIVSIGKFQAVESNILIIFFAGLFIVSTTLFFIRFNRKTNSKQYKSNIINTVANIMSQVTRGWSLIFSDRKTALILIGLVLFNLLLTTLSTGLIVIALGLSISFSALVLFSVLGSLSLFINITPGNLGVKEFVYVAFAVLIGLNATQLLSISIIDRLVTFIVLFFLWIFYGKGVYTSQK